MKYLVRVLSACSFMAGGFILVLLHLGTKPMIAPDMNLLKWWEMLIRLLWGVCLGLGILLVGIGVGSIIGFTFFYFWERKFNERKLF